MEIISSVHNRCSPGRDVSHDALLADIPVGLFAVADGVGVLEGGSQALAATAILRSLLDRKERADRDLAWLNEAFLGVHAQLRRAQPGGPGTTLTALVLGEGMRALLGHAGDSMAYRLRDRCLTPLTEAENLSATLVRHGQLTPEQAVGHPGTKELLNALGIAVQPRVTVSELELAPGDLYLLCSDGVAEGIRPAELEVFLNQRGASWTERDGEDLVEKAVLRSGDDCSLAVVRIVVTQAHGSAE